MECETLKGMVTSDIYILAIFLAALTIINITMVGKMSSAFMEAKRVELEKHTQKMLLKMNGTIGDIKVGKKNA